MGDAFSAVDSHALNTHDSEFSEASMMPWWAHVLIAEWIGCPEVCVELPSVSKLFKDVCNAASVTHNVYACRLSARRLSLPLPNGDASIDGVTPAMFAASWRRKSRELDDLDLKCYAVSHRPVLCPHFGCRHEASSSSSASQHAVSCPMRRNGGFAYAAPAVIMAELEMRKQREVAEVILDANRSGSLGQSPRSSLCVCEVCADGAQWFLKLRQDASMQKIVIDSSLCIHRGWLLDDLRRTTLERGAFPRGVDRSPFIISHRVNDESYRYSRSCGVHVLSGWVLCDDESSGGRCSNSSSDHSQRRLVLPDGAWDSTLALVLPSKPDSLKCRRAEEVRRRFSQGCFSSLYLYIPKIVDLSFPACDTGESWQTILARHLEENRSKVSAQVHAEVTRLLEVECPRPVTGKDLDEEYAFCNNDIVFITFSSQSAAEGFARWLEIAMQDFMVEEFPDNEKACCHSSPSMLLLNDAGESIEQQSRTIRTSVPANFADYLVSTKEVGIVTPRRVGPTEVDLDGDEDVNLVAREFSVADVVADEMCNIDGHVQCTPRFHSNDSSLYLNCSDVLDCEFPKEWRGPWACPKTGRTLFLV